MTYRDLARALASTRPRVIKIDGDWARTMRAIADVCSDSNPRFDRERFVNACMDWGVK